MKSIESTTHEYQVNGFFKSLVGTFFVESEFSGVTSISAALIETGKLGVIL